jgi:cytidine deaminase
MIKTMNISFTYQEFEKPGELSPDDIELVSKARASTLNSYAPYSRFKVGAAVRLMSGKIVCGSNVENAAFPSGICAERNAISNCVTNHHEDKVVAIAIAAMTKDGFPDEPVSPCGNCRQVIAEEESRNGNKIRVILSGKNKSIVIDSISDLLPLQFNKDNLKISLP